jgi:hypothetical protein
MCDYSLHAQPNRLAIEGERLVVYRFSRGSIGLASPSDLQDAKPRPWWSWTVIKMWFQAQEAELRPICAVCVPPGARLVVREMPENLQQELKVSEAEQVTFVQLTADEYTYRDAVCFSNGRKLLLQKLHPGQRVDVLRLSCDEAVAELERHPEIPVCLRR